VNGKYMGWREQRWTSRDAKRLEHMKRKREADNAMQKQIVQRPTALERYAKAHKGLSEVDLHTTIHHLASSCKTESWPSEYVLYAVANGEMTVEQSLLLLCKREKRY